jgi:NAD(P)-dependent dehydrogenase (short-subunit alcohol dehydrogenase family)
MSGKTVLITGGTGGIGLATAKGLSRMGAHVVVVGHNRLRADSAVAEIRSSAPGARVDLILSDMSAQSAVRDLAGQVLADYPRLDVLVNNVGGFWSKRDVTTDGLERTFALNHLAPFLLTNLLLDRLRASSPARIVTVSSGAHVAGRINFADLQWEKRYSGQRAYAQSKLANLMFTRSLARMLPHQLVTANALHPGVVNTGFGQSEAGGVTKPVIDFSRRFMRSPEQGALTSIYLASAPAVAGTSGVYFKDCHPKVPGKRALDNDVADRLWRVSLELTGLASQPRADRTGESAEG